MRKTRSASSMMPASRKPVNDTAGRVIALPVEREQHLRVVYLRPDVPVRITVDADFLSAEVPTSTVHTIQELWPEFEGALYERDLSPKTVSGYRESVFLFSRFAGAHGFPSNVAELDTVHVRGWLADMARRGNSSATRRNRLASLRVFARWLVTAGHRKTVVTDGVPEPRTHARRTPVLTDAQINALLAVCESPRFEDLRDRAIISVLLDSGVRVSELVGMRLDATDMDAGRFTVRLKGGAIGEGVFGAMTALDLRRYLDARAARPFGYSDALWMGRNGPLAKEGVQKMLRRRGEHVGITNLHAHLFRHTFSHVFRVNGGSEGDLQQLGHWADRSQLSRYGASAAFERAAASHREVGVRDRYR